MSEIFEIVSTAECTATTQAVINRYYYWVDAEFVPTVADAQTLATSFEFIVLNAVLDVVSSEYRYIRTTVLAVSNTVEYISNNRLGSLGTRPTPSAPAQLPWSFKLQRTTRLTKSGGKRYSPIGRSDVTSSGEPSGPSISAALATLGGVLGVGLAVDSVPTPAIPIIWGRSLNNQPVSLINPISVGIFVQASSQDSRTNGAGS